MSIYRSPRVSPSRRRVLSGLAFAPLLATPFLGTAAHAAAAPPLGIDYLERLAEPGALHESVAYLAPSALHPAYSHAIYVNTAWSGEGMQKMWVLDRDGDGWGLALHDAGYWGTRGEDPAWSWPVSTGKLWPGNDRAGLTPTGIFNVDERSARHRTGWGSPGMYKAIYIDLHYSSGRIAGVAMHGTTANLYRRLGRPDSHGCVRMTTDNADALSALIHDGGPREASALWGEVPRYFASAPEDSLDARTGYVRDGSLLTGADGALLTRPGYRALCVFFRDDL